MAEEKKALKVLSRSGVRTYVLNLESKKRFQQDFWSSMESVIKDFVAKVVKNSDRTTLTGEDVLVEYRKMKGE